MVLIKLSEGTLEGAQEENEYGGSFYSFKGIPYAEPPLGKLRFKAPQPVKPWNGVRIAKELGSKCFQFDNRSGKCHGSEDCLYLNVYTPDLNPAKPLPVMVWIHGGAFYCGDGEDDKYGPKFLIRHDIVYVAMNYRLDILGFLSLDIEEVPGNAGLKDQVAALRWVKKNISHFGGDPENITIFGHSAGSACVSFHLMSPMTKGLFKRAIAQSGSSIHQWAYITNPLEKAIACARKLDFTSTDPYEIYEFLQSQPVENIVKLNVPLTFDEQIRPVGIHFAVVSEKKFGDNEVFFTGDILETLRRGIHQGVDVMSGFAEHEGIFSLNTRGNFDNILKNVEILEFFCPSNIRYHCTKKQILEVARQMRTRYLKDHLVTEETVWDLIKYLSLHDFNFDVIRWQKIAAKSSRNKFYLYKFTCKSVLNIITDLFGQRKLVGPGCFATHADDLMYMFPMIKIGLDSKEFKMIEMVTSLWTNFAKYGNPTPDGSLGAHWAPYSPENQDYMDIGEQLVPGTQIEREDIQFWEDIYRQYLPKFLPCRK